MEIRSIITFLQVASTQNFSLAAKQLGYSQSAITVQIKKLEKELDTQLFERMGKRVYLTEKGEQFIPYAENILKVTNEAANFSKAQTALKGVLKIGGVESICTALLPDLLLQFHKQYPNVHVVIKSGTTDQLLQMARSNEIDMIFTLDDKLYLDDFTCDFNREEEICFVTKADKKYKKHIKHMKIDEIIKEPLILTELWGAYQYQLLKLLAARDVKISPILEIGNTETIINLLKNGMGISFLPKYTVSNDIERGQLMKISSDLEQVNMYSQLLYHKNKFITPQMNRFINLIKDKL